MAAPVRPATWTPTRVAHGQLDEKELEKRMLSFLRGDSDVLVYFNNDPGERARPARSPPVPRA